MLLDVELRESSATLRLSGEAGVGDAVRLKAALTPALLAMPELRLDMAGLTSIDVAMVQLIHALCCGSRKRRQRVVRSSAVPAEVLQAAAEMGAAGLGCGRVCGEPSCVFEGC